jgi:hypothetical protein
MEAFKKHLNEEKRITVTGRRSRWVNIRQLTKTNDKHRRYDRRGIEGRNRRYTNRRNKIHINNIHQQNSKQQRIRALQQHLQQAYGI